MTIDPPYPSDLEHLLKKTECRSPATVYETSMYLSRNYPPGVAMIVAYVSLFVVGTLAAAMIHRRRPQPVPVRARARR
ncbi:hypothetical protein BRPE64_BCDS03270 [Caballeronia insecticola]|uniref:Uncharacterized protein n=1 Tax=Caballeronia insecticola TaxID=758793 RepID=R4WKB5_9BURK|nr:hypothetical protein BRPE64_BCDS03270 [Caballeronia insecticola]